MKLIVLGAGGHAKVVIEACVAAGHHVAGILDRQPPGTTVLGYPVLGTDEILPQFRREGLEGAVVAVGSNKVRQRLAEHCVTLGYQLPCIIHPSASISPSARVGIGSVVMARAVVGVSTLVGEHVIINTGAVIDHDGRIGMAAHIAPGCALAGCVTAGARALVGVGSSVMPGVVIGEDATVGAGSAVIRDVAAGSVVAGAPARPLNRRPLP